MKNSKAKYILIIIALAVIIGAIIYFFTKDTSMNMSQNNNEPSASRTSTDANVDSNTNTNTNTNMEVENKKNVSPKETAIASFSTVIGDNSAGRLTNIRITCGIINGTVINPNQTFSFNEIVGKPTAERGYQEAKIIVDHKIETGIGGGNCQVSSTLYNAVLAVPSLTVIERSEHGKEVGYVPKGKDAAVSYGSLDFKFKNSTGNKIKINMGTDDKNITATIVQIEE